MNRWTRGPSPQHYLRTSIHWLSVQHIDCDHFTINKFVLGIGWDWVSHKQGYGYSTIEQRFAWWKCVKTERGGHWEANKGPVTMASGKLGRMREIQTGKGVHSGHKNLDRETGSSFLTKKKTGEGIPRWLRAQFSQKPCQPSFCRIFLERTVSGFAWPWAI